MNSHEIRKKYLDFYASKKHTIIPSSSLVPDNDPTTLFTGSGMQPLIPYLLGAKHPQGTRLVDSQKSFRSGDIEDIGDNRHTTFFEMLGNWSLGDYFKKEQLPWVFEFLIDHVGLDPKKLYVTVFIGDEKNNLPRDTDSVAIWKDLFAQKGIEAKDVEMGSEAEAAEKGMQNGRIFYYDGKKNWWSRSGEPSKMPAGEPGGPDSELFYEFDFVQHDPKFGTHCHPNCDCGRYLEIGNSVFMEYKKNADGTFSKLPQQNVDFGGGLERIAMASVYSSDIFDIDLLKGIVTTLESLSGKSYKDAAYTAAFRVVADHIRSATFLIGDGVSPSNSERGYFVRRLLRRAIRFWDTLGIANGGLSQIVLPLLEKYKEAYPETYAQSARIITEIDTEEKKFRATLRQGLKEFEKLAQNKQISGEQAFALFSSYGFPIEITLELAKEKNITVDREAFDTEMKKHQDLSRAGSEKKFKGGLADTSEMSLKYHTATHLLNAGLRAVLGNHIGQKGSNITPERLRFDFNHVTKLTDEEKKKVEDFVNEAIARKLPVSWKEMPKTEAEKLGAIHAFGEKYGDIVKVYSVGDETTGVLSREFCGGPHVENTGVLGHFKIAKEEAVSAGVRRIKAVLE
ncbi:MAG: alanine--tRNA ligase [Candidatus Taylorbacteria bacterium]|nr:alanine--tRNA ligase [Candidatus Taylorbacteria bacterium]